VTSVPCLDVLQKAIELGADFIETDILATQDGVLVCCHDIELSIITGTTSCNSDAAFVPTALFLESHFSDLSHSSL
jgi:glycerophosphoryl diester phosphodiesterase